MTPDLLRSHFFDAMARVDRAGVRPPKTLVTGLNAAYHAYMHRLLWPRLSRRGLLSGIRQVRTEGARIGGVRDVHFVSPARQVAFTDPRHQRFLRFTVDYPGNRQTFAAPFVCRLERPFVHVPTGAVLSGDRTLLVESVGGKVERFLTSTPLPSAVPLLRGTYTTIQHRWASNYHHWLVDCLSRTFVLAQDPNAEPLGVLVPASVRAFQQQSLASCLGEGSYIRKVDDEWVMVEELIFPSHVAEPSTGWLPPECIAFLRGHLLGSAGIDGPAAHRRRLYVSRARAACRRVVNEEQIAATLAEVGFEVLRPEELSFEDQVRRFHEAEVIVGARGAGLTNMLFATQATVLELASTAPFAGVAHFSLAFALGHGYRALFATEVGRDYWVDAAALQRELGAMGIHEEPRQMLRAGEGG